MLRIDRIYEGLTKTEDQIKQEQTISKFPEEALKLVVPTLSGSSKNTQPDRGNIMMGKCSDCWWWDKSNGECANVDAMEKGFNPIGEDEAGIAFNTQDDQGVRIWLHAQGHPSNFGCVKFKRMFKKEGK